MNRQQIQREVRERNFRGYLQLMGEEGRRKFYLRFIEKCLQSNGRCLQGCGLKVKPGQNFCSAECLERYNLYTWGEGREPEPDLTPKLQASLRAARKKGRRG